MKSLFALAVLCGISSGCSSSSSDKPSGSITAGDVARQAYPVICTKMRDCRAEDFGTAFPAGIDQCVNRIIAEVATSKNLDAPAGCAQAEVDTCTAELAMMPCSESTAGFETPASCDKCSAGLAD